MTFKDNVWGKEKKRNWSVKAVGVVSDLQPRLLCDVAETDSVSTLLNQAVKLPRVLSPILGCFFILNINVALNSATLNFFTL